MKPFSLDLLTSSMFNATIKNDSPESNSSITRPLGSVSHTHGSSLVDADNKTLILHGSGLTNRYMVPYPADPKSLKCGFNDYFRPIKSQISPNFGSMSVCADHNADFSYLRNLIYGKIKSRSRRLQGIGDENFAVFGFLGPVFSGTSADRPLLSNASFIL